MVGKAEWERRVLVSRTGRGHKPSVIEAPDRLFPSPSPSPSRQPHHPAVLCAQFSAETKKEVNNWTESCASLR
jgi:hypothetical protein